MPFNQVFPFMQLKATQWKKLHQKLCIASNIKKVNNRLNTFPTLFLLTFQKLLLSVEKDNNIPGNKLIQQALQQRHSASSHSVQSHSAVLYVLVIHCWTHGNH